MPSYWRLAGLNYLQYSAICARYLRRALKPEFRDAAILKKEDSSAKIFRWKEGNPGTAEQIRQSQ